MTDSKNTDLISGAQILVDALKQQGIKYIFGIVGVPVTGVAILAQQCGINYIGMRNEQSACYAAGIIGYLTKRPAVCLTVSGPGLLHVIGGMANALVNQWPLVVISGASDSDQENRGAFQEYPQLSSVQLHTVFSSRPSSLSLIPFTVEEAIRRSMNNIRPGPSYIDIPGNMLEEKIPAQSLQFKPHLPSLNPAWPQPILTTKALRLLQEAKHPLIIIGKGAAYAHAEENLRALVDQTQLPFLPTPMGKGVMPDTHPLCMAAARSKALREADVILVIGARLNWMLHFGLPPRFNPHVKFIQVDLNPEQFNLNTMTNLAIHGDINGFLIQLLEILAKNPWRFNNPEWIGTLDQSRRKNLDLFKAQSDDHTVPLNYYAAFKQIQELIPSNAMIVNEGANTMDIGRTMLPNILPRHRLDAGTFGTMGVGLGFGIAAALWCKDHAPDQRVVCVLGDSAFGFSGMEVETIARYKLPIIIIIFNNNGIYSGLNKETFDSIQDDQEPLPLTIGPQFLVAECHYEVFANLCPGGRGWLVQSVPELREAFTLALQSSYCPALINLLIDPSAQRKPQEFSWLTRSKM